MVYLFHLRLTHHCPFLGISLTTWYLIDNSGIRGGIGVARTGIRVPRSLSSMTLQNLLRHRQLKWKLGEMELRRLERRDRPLC